MLCSRDSYVERLSIWLVRQHLRKINSACSSRVISSLLTEIYLERAVNRTLADYLLQPENPPASAQQRLSWCREAAEAVAHIHSQRVLHCDIQPTSYSINGYLRRSGRTIDPSSIDQNHHRRDHAVQVNSRADLVWPPFGHNDDK